MDNVHLLGDIHQNVLVSRDPLLQPSLALYCGYLGNSRLQPHSRFGQVTDLFSYFCLFNLFFEGYLSFSVILLMGCFVLLVSTSTLKHISCVKQS